MTAGTNESPAGAAAPRVGARLRAYGLLFALAACVLAADQGTKAWVASRIPFGTYWESPGAITVVPGFFYIVHVGNTGAAWSLMTGSSVLLAGLAAATLAAIFLCRRALELRTLRSQLCFGLLTGGILGNLTDRVIREHGPIRHYVVDFIDLHFGSYIYPTFNVADSAICAGVVLYLLQSLTPRSPSAPGSAPARS